MNGGTPLSPLNSENMKDQKETNVRFNIPEDTYKKVLKVQGLFSYKEGVKVTMQDVYVRLIERGAMEILRQSK